MKASRLLIISTLIAVFGLVAGCQQQRQIQTEPRDAWGIVRIAPGHSISVRVAASQSDPNLGMVGIEQRRGAELAARQFDTIQGFQVSLADSNPACSSDGGVSAAHDATFAPETVAVIGMTCSSSCLSSAPILNDAHMIEVSPSCEAGALTDPVSRRETYFTTSFGAQREGQISADFAFGELDASRVAIIAYDNPETADLVDAFTTRLTGRGATVVKVADVKPGQTSFDTILDDASSVSPDLIYAPLLPGDSVTLAVQIKKSKLKDVPLLGGRYSLSQWFINKAQSAAEGVYAVGPGIDNAQVTNIYKAYTDIYRQPPSSAEVVFSYDAMRILLEGIKKVAVVGSDNTLLIGRKALRDAIAQTADYPAASGAITCTAWGDCGAPGTLVVARVSAGKWKNMFIP